MICITEIQGVGDESTIKKHAQINAVASNNEAAALEVMRAAEQLQDEVLRKRLLNLIHRLNQDANDLRMARDDIQGGGIKLA